MDINNILTVGENIDVTYNSIEYKSKVYDLNTTDELIIHAPMKKRKYVNIAQNEVVEIIFYRNNGMFCIKALVIAKSFLNQNMLYRLKVISEPVRIQRRDYFRLPICLNVKLLYLNDERSLLMGDDVLLSEEELLKYEKDKLITMNAYSVNLSGGGLCIKCQEPIPVNTTVLCKFYLNQIGEIKLTAKVVWIQAIYEMYSRYQVGLEFNLNEEKMRELIIKFIYNEQRKNVIRKNVISMK